MSAYFDSAEDCSITYARAIRELLAHGFVRGSADMVEFRREFSRLSFPRPAQDVLAWLGY